MKCRVFGIAVLMTLLFAQGCGETINRRTPGESLAEHSNFDQSKKAKKPKRKLRQVPDKTEEGENTVTVTFSIEPQLISIRPPVDYYFALDSSLSMNAAIEATMQGVIKIAQGILENEQFAGRTSNDDTITVLMDQVAFPNLGKAQATAVHDGVKFTAQAFGEIGNEARLTFDGVQNLTTIVSEWNAANPNNVVIYDGSGSKVLSAREVHLTGGADLPGIIRIKHVSEEYRGVNRPFYIMPETSMLPFTIEYLTSAENPNVGRQSVPHIFLITDSYIAKDPSVNSYLFNIENQYALSAWAPLGLPASTLCRVSETANDLRKLLDDLHVFNKSAVKIDRCSNNFNTTPEFFADIVKATEYKEWIFPDHYWLGKEPDPSGEFIVKVDGEVISADEFTAIPKAKTLKFKSNQKLFGKSKIVVTFKSTAE